MTMYFARTGLARGCGVTEALAIAGAASWHIEDGRLREDTPYTITIIAFDEELYWDPYSDPDPHNPEEWAESVEEIKVEPDEFERLGEHHASIEEVEL